MASNVCSFWTSIFTIRSPSEPVHGANGYLIAQFLDSVANTRTDQWGGSIENRSRFGLEVLKAVVQVFDGNVAIKVSPSGDYNDVG